MTKVGAVIVGRTGRTSIRKPVSNEARAIPGLAHMRSNVAKLAQRPNRRQADAERRARTPLRADGAAYLLEVAELLR